MVLLLQVTGTPFPFSSNQIGKTLEIDAFYTVLYIQQFFRHLCTSQDDWSSVIHGFLSCCFLLVKQLLKWSDVVAIKWLPTNSLMLLLSRFSRVWLCATPETAAHQARPSLGFSRQEHWSGLPFPSSMHESEKWKWNRSVMSDSSRPHGLHAAYQAPPSMGFSRQEYWSGVPLPSPSLMLEHMKLFPEMEVLFDL